MVSNDLSVSHIINVHYADTKTWGMPGIVKRAQSGLVYFISGSITYEFGQEKMNAGPGDVLVFPQGLEYYGTKETESQCFYVIDFFTDPPDALAHAKLPYVMKGDVVIRELFVHCYEQWQNRSLQATVRCRADLYAILGELLSKQMRQSPSSIQLDKMLTYLHAHYAEQGFGMEKFSQALHISTSQIRRIFQKELGVSPLQYVLSLRIDLAKNLLHHECLPVKEVAYRCGFSSEYYFSRLFSEKTGFPPSSFR